MFWFDVTQLHTGLALLMFGTLSLLLEERLAGLDAVLNGFMPLSPSNEDRARAWVTVTGYACFALGGVFVVLHYFAR